MSEFDRPKHRAARTQISRASSPVPNHKRGLSSLIGNQAIQRLLQREGQEQGMTDTVMHALVQMGVPWMQSKEPYTGSVSDM